MTNNEHKTHTLQAYYRGFRAGMLAVLAPAFLVLALVALLF